MMLAQIVKKLIRFFVYFFALIGVVLVLGFFALRFGLTNVAGKVDLNDRYFKDISAKIVELDASSTEGFSSSLINECKILVISKLYPDTGRILMSAYGLNGSRKTLDKMILASEIYLQVDPDYQKSIKSCYDFNDRIDSLGGSVSRQTIYHWQGTPEWSVLKGAIIKDQESIRQASRVVDINPRLIVAMLVGEQLRLYNSEREVYKQFFEPLKILGVQSKFSWGVMGIKEETAKEVEDNLHNQNSPFYLGPDLENVLATSTDPDNARFNRLVDNHNHYYSYLYGSLLLKQLISQWQRAGYDISHRPEILATLFNLGFSKSNPNPNPQVGGAEIDIGGEKLSFGSLAFQFYYSGELINEFPNL